MDISNEILTTINHTTLEALGFRNVTPLPFNAEADVFVFGKIKVVLANDGQTEPVVGIDDKAEKLTLEGLIKKVKQL
jgi:hypothetical protein